MTDIQKSFLLRGFLFVVATLVLWTVVMLINMIHDELYHRFIGGTKEMHAVENMVFIWASSTVMWRWLKHRVWIGSRQN